MKPTSPVLAEEFKAKEIVFAKNQSEYLPLPAIRNREGRILTRWTLSDEERAAIANGADLLLSVLTFNSPLQPILLEVLTPSLNVVELAAEMDLLDSPEETEEEFLVVLDSPDLWNTAKRMLQHGIAFHVRCRNNNDEVIVGSVIEMLSCPQVRCRKVENHNDVHPAGAD